jgi:subtilase family serine protease
MWAWRDRLAAACHGRSKLQPYKENTMNTPDINCWVKLITPDNGSVIRDDGGIVDRGRTVVIRYVVANDSHVPAGPLTVVGVLFKDGVRVKPPASSNVVPPQQITVQPNTIWKREWTVDAEGNYDATMLVDVGNMVNEEDEKNNRGQRSFSIMAIPK